MTQDLFLDQMQNYLEDLCKQHKDIQHMVEGVRAFSRFESDAHIQEIVQAGGPNIVVVADISGQRIGEHDDKKIRQVITLLFAAKAMGEDTQSAVDYAVRKSEEMMMDFMARMDKDFEEDECTFLQHLELNNVSWNKFEGPWLDSFYGWEFNLTFKSFMRSYDANKWI